MPGPCGQMLGSNVGQITPVQTTVPQIGPIEFQTDAIETAKDRIEQVSDIADTWLDAAANVLNSFDFSFGGIGEGDIGLEGPPSREINEHDIPNIPSPPDPFEGFIDVADPDDPGDISVPGFTSYPFPGFTQGPPNFFMTDPPPEPDLPDKYVPTPLVILDYESQVREFQAFMDEPSPALEEVTVTNTPVPPYTLETPTFTFPSPPEVIFPEDPGPAPNMADISIPSAPGYTLPPVPTIAELDIPEAPEIDLPVFDALRPDNSLLTPPGELFYYQEEEYISELQSQVYAKLMAEIQAGGTGLGADVEQAIWDRAIQRLDEELERGYDQVDQGWAARGFAFPPGALVGMRSRVRRDIDAKKLDLDRDIMVEQARLAQTNTHFIVEQSLNMEQMLMNHFNQVAQRAFDVARIEAEIGVAIYNAKVNAYAAMMEGYKADAEVFKVKLQAALSELEVYRIKMEGVKIATEVQKLYVDLYEAQLRGVLAIVEIYKAEMQGAGIHAEVEKTKIQAYAEGINAFIARIRAGTARFEAYQAEVQGRLGEVQGYSEQVRAYGLRVDAAKTEADIKAQQASVELDNQRLIIEKYRSEIERYNSDIQNYAMQIQAFAESNKDRLAEVQVGMDIQRLLAEVESRAATVEIERGKLAADLYRAGMARSELDVRAFEAMMGGYEVESRIFAVRVEAAKAQNEIDVQRIRTMVDVEMAGVEIYKANIQKFSAVMSANASLMGARAQMYSAHASMVGAQYTGAAAMYSADADAYRADVAAYSAQADVAIKQAELTIRAAEVEAKLAMEQMSTTARVAGQIAAAALTSINATASVGYSASEANSVTQTSSQNYSNSHQTSNNWHGNVQAAVQWQNTCIGQDSRQYGEYHNHQYDYGSGE